MAAQVGNNIPEVARGIFAGWNEWQRSYGPVQLNDFPTGPGAYCEQTITIHRFFFTTPELCRSHGERASGLL
jgi:hypothetical protein